MDGAEVGAPFQQVGSEGMAESVWTDGFRQADGFAQYLDDVEDHDAGNVFSLPADENEVFVLLFDIHRVPVDEVELELADGTGRNGYEALFVAFPVYFDEAFFQIEVG